MGLTFKENCPDIRNTRVVDIVRELAEYNVRTDVFDPWADSEEAKREYRIALTGEPRRGQYDAIILAVAHDRFRAMGARGIRDLGKEDHVLYDLKYILGPGDADIRL